MTKASRVRLLAILRSLVKLGWSWVELHRESFDGFCSTLSQALPQRLPLGIPIKIAIIKKSGNRAVDDG